jgi:transaldolase
MSDAPRKLTEGGQSLWLDNIRKSLLTSGALERYARELFVTGLTSNPSILEKAIAETEEYDDAIRQAADRGITDPEELVFALAQQDLVAAADLFRPVFDATGGRDGYVSIEVSPGLVRDPDGTVAMGRRLHAQFDRPNVLVKVPGTPECLPAIEALIADGVPVNVTLLFSADQYRAAADAYLRGIERRRDAGVPLAVGSVASVFVSRWDVAADTRLPEELHGKLGLAVVQGVYADYRNLLAGGRWRALEAAGALPQRALWASTSTKDPNLPDTYYLGRLVAPGTVDTVPEPTLLAFADHGEVGDLLEPDPEAARRALDEIEAAGVDAGALAQELQDKGAEAFSASWSKLLERVQERTTALVGAGR